MEWTDFDSQEGYTTLKTNLYLSRYLISAMLPPVRKLLARRGVQLESTLNSEFCPSSCRKCSATSSTAQCKRDSYASSTQTATTFNGKCVSVVIGNALEIRKDRKRVRNTELMNLDSQEGYATRNSSNQSETRVWCLLFLVWLPNSVILLISKLQQIFFF